MTISFGVSKESLLVIEFTNKKKTHKRIDYHSVKKIIENAWNILISKGKNLDSLGLKTGQVKYFRFKKVINKD